MITLPHDSFTTPSRGGGTVSLRWVFLTWCTEGVRSSNQVAPAAGPIGQSPLMISGPEPHPSLYLALLLSSSCLFLLPLSYFPLSSWSWFSMSSSSSRTLAYLISASYLPYSTRRRILVLISTTRRKRERNSPLPLPPSSFFSFSFGPVRRSNAPFWYLVMFHYFPPESLRQPSHLPPKRRGLDSHRPTSVSRRRLNAHHRNARTH